MNSLPEGKPMPIDTLLKKPVTLLGPGATCAEAAEAMRKDNVGCVVVVDRDERPLGIVTDRDIVVKVIARGLHPQNTALDSVMSGEPFFLSGDRDLHQLTATMREGAIRRVPVVGEDGRVRGVVAMDDVLLLLAEELGDLAQAVREEVDAPGSA
jgi:CBS domain-containing protein